MAKQKIGRGYRGIIAAFCLGIILICLSVTPVYGTSLSSLDSDPGLEQTEVSLEQIEEITAEAEAEAEELHQDIEEIQVQIQEDIEAIQTATTEASSAVSDLLQQSQRATRLTLRETWEEFLEQLLRWKVLAQLRTRNHIQTTRRAIDQVGQTVSQTLEEAVEELESSEEIPPEMLQAPS